MFEFDVKLNRKMISDLLLGGELIIELEGKSGKYKLDRLSSMTCTIGIADGNSELRKYSLYCTASRERKEYKVRLLLDNTHGDNWYRGKIVFPTAPA